MVEKFIADSCPINFLKNPQILKSRKIYTYLIFSVSQTDEPFRSKFLSGAQRQTSRLRRDLVSDLILLIPLRSYLLPLLPAPYLSLVVPRYRVVFIAR